MFERDVTVSLNADVSNYSSSLSQAIAITQQYSSAADTALGTVAKLNAGFVQGLIKVSSGLTGPQRMATDTAAAYQQQMSGLQATASVTNQNFGQLEKTTRSLARSFPIGMTQAVQQVEALQGAGVTSNKEIEKLAVSFTKLGAANGSFGPELGQQMLQVTRAFGNGTSQVDALGDSLTTVSKTMGASASGVLTFSKAIAPIASTVGMSQTSVMGLSAAMSRLGEDGYQAANSFQKVMLDMNRGIRDGGPELKVYSDLLNMTSDSLRKMADTDPTEVLIRFTEAIAKAGPDVQRTLDALGLDGVRTTRSLQALSRSGGLREAVSTSVGAYGNGSTNTAAEEAFSGVNDQMTRLSESMRQTVGSAGKPFLGFMEDVLKAGNAVSEVTNKVMENDGVQKLATAGIVGGVGASLLFKGLAATSLGSMVANLFNSGRNSSVVKDFQSARVDARSGMQPAPGSNMASRLGGLLGTAQGPAGAPGAAGASIRERVNQTIRTATGAVGRVMDADRNNMATARGASAPVPMTAAGTALRTSMGDLLRNRDMASLQAAGAASRNYVGNMAATGGAGGLLARSGLYVAEGARTAAAGVRAGAMGAARFMGGLGVTPQLAAVAGIGVLGYAAYQQNRETGDRREAIRSGSSSDIFASFNNFAEATGAAGRGLVNFTAAINAATNNLAKGNTTFKDAGSLTGTEASQAMAPGYQRAFNIIGDASRGGPEQVDAVVQQAIATLGRDAGPEMVARVVSDVANQTNTTFAREVGKQLTSEYLSGDPRIDVSKMLQDIDANTSQNPFFNSTSEESSQIATQMGRSLAQDSYRVSDIYDSQAGAIANVSNAMNMYDEARDLYAGDNGQIVMGVDTNKRRKETTANVGMVLQSQLQLSDEVMGYLFEGGAMKPEDLASMTSEDLIKKLEQYEKDTGTQVSALDVVDEARSRGIDLKNPDYESFGEPTSVEKEAYRLQDSFKTVNSTSSTLSESLYGATAAARDAGLMLDELADRPDLLESLTREQRLVLSAYNDRTPGNVNAAGEAMARQAVRESGGNIAMAQSRIRQETAQAQEGTSYKDVMMAADKLLEVVTATQQAAMPETDRMLQTVQQGRAADRMGKQDNFQLEDTRQAEIAAGTQTSAWFVTTARNFMMQKAQMEVQLQQSREQAGLQASQMARDYNISVSRANEDFRTQEQRSNRDFNIQMRRQDVDFQIDRRRAKSDFARQEAWGQKDFNRQVRHATEDHLLSMGRMERDYGKQVRRTKEDAAIATGRAERDYQKARSRAERDFTKQMNRMEADYQLQRQRANEDYNTSISRASADYLLSRGRAQRDFDKQQAYAEADNLRSRTRAVQDFNKQMKRLIEDSAKSLYDPYKRIQAQMVMDGGQLVANLAAQNKSLADQMGVLDQLRASGLSQQSIDLLGLADTKNAQQAARLLADSMSDPSLIAGLNEQVAGRIDLSAMFVTSEDNVQTRRMSEDFAQQMARMEEDFKTSSARASEQFSTSMADMETDYKTQMSRAAEDFTLSMTRMGDDYKTAVERARADQAQALTDMAADHAQALADAAEDLARVLARMAEDYATAVSDAYADFGRAMSRMMQEYATAVERSRELFKTELERQDADFARMRRRAERDFARQMRDAEKDFRKMLARMGEDYANALGDMGASLALAEKHAMQSLIAYGQNVAKGEREIFRDFAKFITGLPKDMQDEMGESMRGLLKYMRDTFPAMFNQYFPNGVAGLVLGMGRTPTPSERGEGTGPRAPINNPAAGTGPGGAPPLDPGYEYPPWLAPPPSNGVDPTQWPGYSPTPGFTPPATQDWGTPSTDDSSLYPWLSDEGNKAGTSTAEGYIKGLEVTLKKWLPDGIVDDLIDKWKKSLGISSPSRVFMSIGSDTIAGFLKGITDGLPGVSWLKDKITGLFEGSGSVSSWLRNIDEWIPNQIKDGWESLTKNMPDLGKALNTLFTDPGKFLSDINSWIPEKVGKGWDQLVKGWPDVNKTLTAAFNDPGQFLTDLKEWIPKKIGKGWDKLTSTIPGGDTIRDTVSSAFGKLEAWLGKFDTWIEKALPGWNNANLLTAFKMLLLGPAQAAVNTLIGKWNDLELKLGPLSFEILGRQVGPFGPWAIETPYQAPVKWFAQGGIVSGAQTIGVGEQGPEAVIPLNQRGAQVMADTLRQFVGDRTFGGSLSNPYVINVEMADVNLDFTDSGSEFSQQARELLQRVKDSAASAELFMKAAGDRITGIVDDASDSLETLAKAIEDAFGEAASGVVEDTTSIKDAVVSMNDAIETDFTSMSTAIDTDLTDLTSSFSTAVDSIITETDRMIAEAISRLEDFASGLPGAGNGGDTGGGDDGDAGGGDGGDAGGGDGGGDAGSPKWNAFSSDYSVLGAPDKAFVDGLFGGKAPTAESFGALSATQQDVLHRAIIGGLTEEERTTLGATFPGGNTGGGGGGGGGSKPDTSFSRYSTLQSALGKSDKEFLTQAFGGTAPTSSSWNKVTEPQRDALIKALEDKNLTSDERKDIGKLNLPNLGGGGGGGNGEPGSPSPEVKQSWDVFREGYLKLGDSDKRTVDQIFGGSPTFDSWTSLTETQQRRLRDAVRDGALDKDETGQVTDINPYTLLGKQIVDYADDFKGRPYKIPASPPGSFDCSTFTSYVYRKFGKSIASYSDTQFAGGRNVTGEEMPGDLVFFKTHPDKVTGHVGLYIGGGQMIDAPQPGDVVSVNSATSRGDYKGARRYFAEGGIVNRRQDAVIGEAGPEIVVPLNERGAEFFASAMARYAQPQDVRQALVSPYSTPVNVSITHTYDNRTMFTGSIEVAANNPDEFAAKAAAKQRRQRLSQPLGSAR